MSRRKSCYFVLSFFVFIFLPLFFGVVMYVCKFSILVHSVLRRTRHIFFLTLFSLLFLYYYTKKLIKIIMMIKLPSFKAFILIFLLQLLPEMLAFTINSVVRRGWTKINRTYLREKDAWDLSLKAAKGIYNAVATV